MMNQSIWFKERKAIDMRTNITEKPIWRMLTAVLLFMLFMSVPVEVEAAKGITAKKKTLSVGQEYKLKIKGLSTKEKKSRRKVSWKISDKSVVVFKGKGKRLLGHGSIGFRRGG